MFGIIEYNEDGLPKCEICGQFFDRVVAHVRQKHNRTATEYKKEFGFNIGKGICSKESSEKSRIKTIDNYEKCVESNLKKGGEKSRFKKGGKGRLREDMSEQTRLMLVSRINLFSGEMLRENGRKIGLSGLGNMARWGNKKL